MPATPADNTPQDVVEKSTEVARPQEVVIDDTSIDLTADLEKLKAGVTAKQQELQNIRENNENEFQKRFGKLQGQSAQTQERANARIQKVRECRSHMMALVEGELAGRTKQQKFQISQQLVATTDSAMPSNGK